MVEEIDDLVSLFEEAKTNLAQYKAILAQKNWTTVSLGDKVMDVKDMLIHQLDEMAILDVAAQFFVAVAEGDLSKASELQKIIRDAEEMGIGIFQKRDPDRGEVGSARFDPSK